MASWRRAVDNSCDLRLYQTIFIARSADDEAHVEGA